MNVLSRTSMLIVGFWTVDVEKVFLRRSPTTHFAIRGAFHVRNPTEATVNCANEMTIATRCEKRTTMMHFCHVVIKKKKTTLKKREQKQCK